MPKNFLKMALRTIKRNKIFSLINIMGLALGTAVCILIFLWIENEVSTDRFHKQLDNIYIVSASSKGRHGSTTPWALATTLKRDFPEVQTYTHVLNRNWLFRFRNTSMFERGLLVDEDFFKMFSFPLIKTNGKTLFPTPNSLIITSRMARKYFGNEDPLNKVLTINNDEQMTVTAIVQDPPANTGFQFEYLAPIQWVGEKTLNSWSWAGSSYVLLKKNTKPSHFKNKISGIIKKYDKRLQIDAEVGIFPLKKLHLYGLNGNGPIRYVYIFLTIAVMVLLIACFNFMNLSTARSIKRAREVGIRKVIGAKRQDIGWQFFGESILMTFISFLLGLVLVFLFLPTFNTLSAKRLSFDLWGSPTHMAILILLFLFTSFFAGGYPAMVLSKFRPILVLKGTHVGKLSRNRLLKVLMVIQFTAAVTLIICTSLVSRQLNFIWSSDLGFQREQVMALSLNPQLNKSIEILKNKLAQYDDIEGITIASALPMNITNTNPAYWEGKTAGDYTIINWASVDEDYFNTLGMTFVSGRSFSKKHPADRNHYIINEAMVELTGLKDPVGKKFSIWEAEGQILGVVKNFHSRSLHRDFEPVAFTMKSTWAHRYVLIRMKKDRVHRAIPVIENQVKSLAPDFPFSATFLDDAFGRQYASEQRIRGIFKYFTFFSVFISCLGLFGLASFTAEQRTREIGIRKVLGSSVTGIVTHFSMNYIKWVLLASLLAFPIAYIAMNSWLETFAFRTGFSIWIFLSAVLLASLTALITIVFQFIKAANTHPSKSLHYE